MGELSHQSTPLTREEVLEHALRELVTRCINADVGYVIDDLREPMGSVLDFRAADEIEKANDG
jgi:hypothetical protein